MSKCYKTYFSEKKYFKIDMIVNSTQIILTNYENPLIDFSEQYMSSNTKDATNNGVPILVI